jgi:hypothetical protein
MKLKSAVASATLAATSILFSTAASAAQFNFTFGTTNVIEFQLDSTRAPDSFTAGSASFNDVTITRFGGPPPVTSTVTFFTYPAGGFDAPGAFATFFGLPLFSGPTSAPHFIVGDFTQISTSFCNNIEDGIPTSETCRGEFGRITLKPGVPEPATWAMMLLGFGGLGAALRRSRATASLELGRSS